MLTIFSCAFCLYVWKCLLRFSAQFFYSVVCFFDVELPERFVYFWDIQNILSGFFFLRYTKYLVGCFICKYFLPFSELSYFVYGFLYVQKLLSLIRSHLFIFVYLFSLFLVLDPKRYGCNLYQRVFLPVFVCVCVCKSFIVSGFIFRSLIHFKFI